MPRIRHPHELEARDAGGQILTERDWSRSVERSRKNRSRFDTEWRWDQKDYLELTLINRGTWIVHGRDTGRTHYRPQEQESQNPTRELHRATPSAHKLCSIVRCCQVYAVRDSGSQSLLRRMFLTFVYISLPEIAMTLTRESVQMDVEVHNIRAPFTLESVRNWPSSRIFGIDYRPIRWHTVPTYVGREDRAA